MLKLIVPLFSKNSCYENANKTVSYCLKNFLISPSKAVENFTIRRHFLFSTTNRKTFKAFPTIPQHQLGVSNRTLGQLELLPTNTSTKFCRKFNRSSALLVESSGRINAVQETTLEEKSIIRDIEKESTNRKEKSLYQEDYLEEETFGEM